MSVASETANPIHFISHIHDGDTAYAKYECRAGKDAVCHWYPACDCEEMCDHPKVHNDECWTEPWMNECCAQECFVGPKGTPVHSGPVFVSFGGDCAEWEYLNVSE